MAGAPCGRLPRLGPALVHGLKAGREAKIWATYGYIAALAGVAIALWMRLAARRSQDDDRGDGISVRNPPARSLQEGRTRRSAPTVPRPRSADIGPAGRCLTRCLPWVGPVIKTKPRLACVDPPRLLAGLDEAYRLDRVGHLTVHGTMPALPGGRTRRARGEHRSPRARRGRFPLRQEGHARSSKRPGRAGGRCNVVVNGSEGEPSCLKDTALLLHTPHLVIDGATLAAEAIGAEEVAIAVHRGGRRGVAERGHSRARPQRGPGVGHPHARPVRGR